MNKLQIIRNNLLAKGILDAQLSALLIDFEHEYTELVDAVTVLKNEVNCLNQMVVSITSVDKVSSPVEDGDNDLKLDLDEVVDNALKDTFGSAELKDTKDDDAVAKAGSTTKDMGNLSANFRI